MTSDGNTYSNRRSRWLAFALADVLAATLAAAAPFATKPNRWTLETADTSATIRVTENQVYVSRLANPHAKHNWAGEMTIPLMAKVWVGPREFATAWKFYGGKHDSTAGMLTLVFTNAEPAMALTTIWRARPGRGHFSALHGL